MVSTFRIPGRGPAFSARGVVLAVLCLLPLSATAQTSPPPSYEIEGAGEIPELPKNPARQADLSAGPGWRAFQARHPGWVARWDEARAVPERAQGPGLRLGRSPQSAAQALLDVKAWLEREAAPWLAGAELHPVRAARQGDSWWVQFAQDHQGIRVVGGRAHARVSALGDVSLFGLDVFPGVATEVVPGRTEAQARHAALTGFPAGLQVEAPRAELVILPVPAPQGTVYRLAYEVHFSTVDPAGDWLAYVDAGDGALLRRVNQARSEQVAGNVSAPVEPLAAGDLPVRVPLRHVQLTLLDAVRSVVAQAVTDVDGDFSVGPLAPGSYTLEALLAGPYGRISNYQDGQRTPLLRLTAVAGGPSAEIVFTDSDSRIQDRDAFSWSMIAHDYVKRVEAGYDYLDYPMPLVVDYTRGECNAFWNGFGIVFYAAGQCPAASRSASVVIHEYGHGVTDYQYRPFYPSAAMHEGFSDYFSATVLNDPRIGHGFFGPNTQIRRIDLDRVWPRDVTGEPHQDGLIIAGALWDVRQDLGRALTDALWHYARYGLADNFDDYFFDLLLADDTNGNVYDGTPHLDVLVDNFRKHGIGDYAIHVAHEPVPDTEDSEKFVSVRASFLSILALVDSTVTVHVKFTRPDSTWREDRLMLPTGGIREFETVIDPQPPGTQVQYWFTARNIDGATVTDPPAGAAAAYRFGIGPDHVPPVVVHDLLPDQPLDMPVLRIHAVVRDNLDQAVGAVDLTYAAGGAAETTLPMHPVSADHFEAEFPLTGLALGDSVSYLLQALDGAALPNVTRVPAAGRHRFFLVPGFGRDFEADDGGLHPAGDWEWGDPRPYRSAYSGTRVWATNLDGPYADRSSQDLDLGPVDLSEFSRAALVFHHTYDIEAGYDGASVSASTDGGLSWTLLYPEGDYPYAQLPASGLPGYSGKQPEWVEAEFELSAFRGQPDVRFRFRLQSDEAVSGPGWFLDDVQVVARQVLARPRFLDARSGEDGRVPLAWTPPLGLSPEDDHSPLVGYRVYRSEAGGPFVLLSTADGPRAVDSTAVNGVYYAYRVTSVYTDGESPPGESVEAIPYVARYQASSDSIAVAVDTGVKTSVDLEFRNPGTGFLRCALWPADRRQTLDDVRIRYRVTESPVLLELATDGDDVVFLGILDIAALDAAGGPGSVLLRLTSHGNWVSFRSDFNVRIAFDVDGNPETGPGGDYYLLAGYTPWSVYRVPALIFDEQGTPVGEPTVVVQPDSASIAEWTIPLDLIGRPVTLGISVTVLTSSTQQVLDQLPDPPRMTWLQPRNRFVEVFQGAMGSATIDIRTQGLFGTYRAQLLLDTNDPDQPAVAIPVSLDVGNGTPVELLSFRGESDDLGVVLRWQAAQASAPGFHVYRSETPGGEWRRLTNTPVPATAGGAGEPPRFLYEDREVLPGGDYLYRLGEVSRGGEITFHGAIAVRYTGALALTQPVIRPNAPNPFRSTTTLRFGLPAEEKVTLRVVRPDGRLVRTLLAGATTPVGFHEVVWDGHDDAGRAAGAGLYLVVLEAGVTRLAHKIVLVP